MFPDYSIVLLCSGPTSISPKVPEFHVVVPLQTWDWIAVALWAVTHVVHLVQIPRCVSSAVGLRDACQLAVCPEDLPEPTLVICHHWLSRQCPLAVILALNCPCSALHLAF